MGRRHRLKAKRGRPVSTGSSSTPAIQYRVSSSQYAELTTEAKRLRVTVNEVAKRRAFPPNPTIRDAAERAGYSWELGPTE